MGGRAHLGRGARDVESFVGVELFQIERYEPGRDMPMCPDPIQVALGVLAGKLSATATPLVGVS